MVSFDENALICDLAETYGIYDMEALPAATVAVLSCGLREDSRIMQKISGQRIPMNSILLSGIADRISIIAWMLSEDGRKGRNRPTSIYEALTQKEPEKNHQVYRSVDDFEAAHQRAMKKHKIER